MPDDERIELWTDLVWGLTEGLPAVLDLRRHDQTCWLALMRRRETLWLATSDHYEALGRALVMHLHASRGGPLVVNAYASPELEFVDWEEATDLPHPDALIREEAP